MRAVVQRVSSATVDIDGVRIAAIGTGLAVLLGVTHDDDTATAAAMARKIHGLRILEGERSVSDTAADVLVVSQFTLYGDTRKGRRPSWSAAAAGAHAEPLVAQVVADLRGLGAVVATGRFGARMSVGVVNEGPMTVLLEL